MVVGATAYNHMRLAPEKTINSVKRLMGRGFNDPKVQDHLKKCAYKVTPDSAGTDNSLSVWLGHKEYSPEDISAEILKKIIQNATAYRQHIGKHDESINQAVITIPAYFNDKQKNATRVAALKAGLTPLELLSEPTAAAISYGFSPDNDDVQTILVYDFGGGTFDASLIVASGSQFIEQGKAGDLWLGGDDVDLQLIQFVKDQVAKQEGLNDINTLIDAMPHYEKVRLLADLKLATERAKIELSQKPVVRIDPPTPLKDEFGMAIPIEVEITQEIFERMIEPLVSRSIKICHEALQLSEYTPDLIDVVLLVGGSSQIPYVRRRMQEAFGQDKVVFHPRPMYAIAEGAAIVAAGLTDKVGSVSRDYCIKLQDDPRYRIIRRGDILPVQCSHTFKLVADNQRLIHFEFFSPDDVSQDLDATIHDERIGDMWLALDQEYSKGTEIQVYLDLDDKENALKIHAHLRNDPSVSVSCSFSRGRSDEKILSQTEQLIEELNELGLTELGVATATDKISAVVKSANYIVDSNTGEERPDMRDTARQQLDELTVMMSKERLDAEADQKECELLLNLCEDFLPDSQQQRIQTLKEELEIAIAQNNIGQMQATCERVAKEFDNLPPRAKFVQFVIMGIRRASQVNPSEAQVMFSELDAIISAFKREDNIAIERLSDSLFSKIQKYAGISIPDMKISTGLSR